MGTKIKITFLGAAGTVTGSKFLLEFAECIVLVDCGLFQGVKELRLLNRKVFPFPPDKINYILITHGHLDHCGYLPRLVKEGFSDPIILTAPTWDIASIILYDSAKIQEEDAEKANRENYTRHSPAKPLYTNEDVEKAVSLFKKVQPGEWKTLNENLKIRFKENGHILGATFIEVEYCGKRLVFSGDIGRQSDDLLYKPNRPQKADFLILESTYGNRLHIPDNFEEHFILAVNETIANEGTLIVPSFAVERLQTVMYKIWKLHNQKKVPPIKVFTDSPMGNDVFNVFTKYPEWHKLSLEECNKMRNHFTVISSYKDTWKTLEDPSPKVVIAGSGMVTGGRVLTCLRYLIDKPETTILLVGYQAEGTRGRQLLEGAQEVKIFGQYCPVRAKISCIQSLSAHADQNEIIEWLSEIKEKPTTTFIVHGEPTASDALRVKVKDTYNWPIEIPHINDQFVLEW